MIITKDTRYLLGLISLAINKIILPTFVAFLIIEYEKDFELQKGDS